jgi:hypothetical protein
VICGHLDPDLVTLADELLLDARAEEQLEAEPAQPDELAPLTLSAHASGEEIFGDPGQAEEILDIFI